eukprot:TRINITY_DN8660_c0_g1_i1.p1 TRINITY_DN8660_c0_g1~~TRINITY_DN8660_c0_g1_i1.p1  ORF type:complete len:905 (+),score=161.33 TRINITY_DN8660_c0_g1_i1:66-2780(+)
MDSESEKTESTKDSSLEVKFPGSVQVPGAVSGENGETGGAQPAVVDSSVSHAAAVESSIAFLSTQRRSTWAGLPEEDLTPLLVNLFDCFDEGQGGSGRLYAAQIVALLGSIGASVSPYALTEAMKTLDPGLHSLDAKEFAALVSAWSKTDAELKTAVAEWARQHHEMTKEHARNLLLHTAMQSKVLPLESRRRWALDALVVLAITYHAAVAPMRIIGFDEGYVTYWFEVLLSLFMVGEVAVCFHTAVVSGQWVIEERKASAWRYFVTWFTVDALGSFPFDLLAALFVPMPVVGWLQCLRLLRILKFPYLFALSPRGFLEPSVVWLKVTFLPLFWMAMRMLVVVHWLTIIWVAVFDLEDAEDAYIHSLYLVVETLTTVGYGDLSVTTRSQRFYAVFLFVVGVIINGYVVSRLTMLLVQTDLTQDRDAVLQRTLAVVRKFQLPQSLQREVLSFQFHSLSWSTSATFREVLEALPSTMQQHIAIFVRIHIVMRIPHFTAATPECQVALAQALEEIVLPPSETVCEQGEIGHELYFIVHGCANVHLNNGQSVAVLKRGSFFGHLALLHEGSKRTANVTTITYCAMLCLRKQDFDAIRARFREFSNAIDKEAGEIAGSKPVPEPTPRDQQANPLRPRLSAATAEVPMSTLAVSLDNVFDAAGCDAVTGKDEDPDDPPFSARAKKFATLRWPPQTPVHTDDRLHSAAEFSVRGLRRRSSIKRRVIPEYSDDNLSGSRKLSEAATVHGESPADLPAAITDISQGRPKPPPLTDCNTAQSLWNKSGSIFQAPTHATVRVSPSPTMTTKLGQSGSAGGFEDKVLSMLGSLTQDVAEIKKILRMPSSPRVRSPIENSLSQLGSQMDALPPTLLPPALASNSMVSAPTRSPAITPLRDKPTPGIMPRQQSAGFSA